MQTKINSLKNDKMKCNDNSIAKLKTVQIFTYIKEEYPSFIIKFLYPVGDFPKLPSSYTVVSLVTCLTFLLPPDNCSNSVKASCFC